MKSTAFIGALICLSVATPAFCAADSSTFSSADQVNSSTQSTADSLEESIELEPARSKNTYTLEAVASFDKYMPRGVVVTKNGRIFVCFPRHDLNHDYTFAEIKDNKTIPFPDVETNKAIVSDPRNHFISIMSATVDSKNRLWLLDNGRVFLNQIKDGCKLLAIDLSTGKIVKNISFPDDINLATSSFKDLRIDEAIGADGIAIIIDSAALGGPSGIVVVDLNSGKSIRRLNNHSSVTAEPDFVIFADGEMLLLRESEDNKKEWTPGVAGLALSAGGKELYYSPMSCPEMYSVSIPKLCDASITEANVEKTIKSIGREVGTSDGIESDSQNNLYLTDVEDNSIWKRNPNGKLEIMAKDDRLSWPDRLYLAPDGYLYITASQFHRSPWFHYGEDMRELPYQLFRIKINVPPVRLK